MHMGQGRKETDPDAEKGAYEQDAQEVAPVCPGIFLRGGKKNIFDHGRRVK
jgi:hypothetical protein